ncbi:MAG: hypothetical protein EOP42_18870, partial [Sphingobacteriaceae bacterium]
MARIARKTLSYLLKSGIVFLTIWFVYRHLNNNQNLAQFVNRINKISKAEVYLAISLVTVLMLMNWLLEAIKWKYLTKLL